MKLFSRFFYLFAFFVLFQSAHVFANCFCYNTKTPDWSNIVGCDDNELEEECRRAEFEFTDFNDGFMQDARARMMAYPGTSSDEETNLADLAKLNEALEQRPVLDCASGLFTTRLARNSRVHCYSKELLDECHRAQQAAMTFYELVPTYLSNQNASLPFIAWVQSRLAISQTLDVTCKLSDIITSAAASQQEDNVTISMLSLGTVATMLVALVL